VGSVVGYLWTSNNTPITDATVQLRDVVSGSVELFTRTSQAGEFRFNGVRPGQYVVEYLREATQTAIATGHPFTLSAGETVAIGVRLANTLPLILPDKSRISITGSVGWTRNLTYENEGMPGGLVEVTLPIGPGQWVVVEGALYHRTYRDSDDTSASIYRGGISVAGRLGATSHRGLFGQIGAGVYGQSVDARGGGSSYVHQYRLDGLQFALTPAIGFDLRLGDRVSWRTLAEVQLNFRHPRDRWFNPQVKTGLAVTLGAR
jgi:hypothetical protein